jgi:P27 family predicted phage terminase small subunit
LSMGRRGPPPTPTKLKMLRGNPGKRPLNAAEPEPDPTPPACPEWLDDIARAKWEALAPELTRLGLLTSVDGDAFAAYCQAFAELQIATEALKSEDRYFTTDKGYMMPHPAVAMQRSALENLKKYSALFGLDPSSRSRLATPGDKPKADPFDKFLSKKPA